MANNQKIISFIEGIVFPILIIILLSYVIFSKITDNNTTPTHNMEVVSVIDGDTIRITAPFLPKELGPNLSLRILGVDTPEKAHRAKCPREADLGERATLYTKDAVHSAKNITIRLKKWDKYGGRVLGDLIIDGNSLSKMLIDSGNAREYNGGTKSNWCN